MKKSKSILKLVLFMAITIAIFAVAIIIRHNLISITQKNLDMAPYEIKLVQKIDDFSVIAQELHTDGVYEFCMQGVNKYKINGVVMDFKENKFNYSTPVNIKNVTLDEALALARVKLENINKYKKFLNSYPFVNCIEEDLNLKTGKEYSLLLQVNNFKGFVYISDGSISESVRKDIIDEKYKELERIGDTNWYKFSYKNEYGI